MFRALLFLLGAAIIIGVALYFRTGRRRYLSWSGWLLAGGLASGVFFFTVLLIKRLI